MKRFICVSLCGFSMMLMTGTPAQGDLPYILEPPAVSAIASSINVAGPLDFCGEPVPMDEPGVRENLEKELLITLWNRPQVILWMKRSGRFMSHIEEMLRKNNMPVDLKYLVIIESSLISHVTSSKGAKGYWQFIEDTGKRYGLSINTSVDERRNFYSSTRAALNYLKDLYAMLGSWTMAAAAYNMGEEGLKSEAIIQKTKNYYKLYLPLETQRYIFRALSAKMILSNPEKYGFKLTKEDLYPPVQFDRAEVVCEEEIPLSLIARAAGTSFKIIKELNPEIKGYYLVKGRHELLIPKDAADRFRMSYEGLVNEWKKECKEHVYVVKRGENLSSIAKRFKVPLPALLVWNHLTPSQKIKPGMHLLIFPDEGTPGK